MHLAKLARQSSQLHLEADFFGGSWGVLRVDVPVERLHRIDPKTEAVQLTRQLGHVVMNEPPPVWGSKPEPPKIPSADQRGLSRARSMG